MFGIVRICVNEPERLNEHIDRSNFGNCSMFAIWVWEVHLPAAGYGDDIKTQRNENRKWELKRRA